MKKAIDIKGIYFWGKGITIEMNEKWEKIVSEIIQELGYKEEKTQFGVQQIQTDTVYVYFHAMSTVVETDSKEEIRRIVDVIMKKIISSDLPVTVDVRDSTL